MNDFYLYYELFCDYESHVCSGRNSPLVQFQQPPDNRPSTATAKSGGGEDPPPGILKRREKSSSPPPLRDRPFIDRWVSAGGSGSTESPPPFRLTGEQPAAAGGSLYPPEAVLKIEEDEILCIEEDGREFHPGGVENFLKTQLISKFFKCFIFGFSA